MRETSIGLKRGTVRLEPYNPVWTQMFEAAISSLTDEQDFIEKLPMLGYQYLPNRSYPVPEYAYRHFFIKGPESNRTHHR